MEEEGAKKKRNVEEGAQSDLEETEGTVKMNWPRWEEEE